MQWEHSRRNLHGGGRARNSEDFVCLHQIPLKNIYIQSTTQETSLQTYTLIFSLQVKMVDILMDLNENEAVKTSGHCRHIHVLSITGNNIRNYTNDRASGFVPRNIERKR